MKKKRCKVKKIESGTYVLQVFLNNPLLCEDGAFIARILRDKLTEGQVYYWLKALVKKDFLCRNGNRYYMSEEQAKRYENFIHGLKNKREKESNIIDLKEDTENVFVHAGKEHVIPTLIYEMVKRKECINSVHYQLFDGSPVSIYIPKFDLNKLQNPKKVKLIIFDNDLLNVKDIELLFSNIVYKDKR